MLYIGMSDIRLNIRGHVVKEIIPPHRILISPYVGIGVG